MLLSCESNSPRTRRPAVACFSRPLALSRLAWTLAARVECAPPTPPADTPPIARAGLSLPLHGVLAAWSPACLAACAGDSEAATNLEIALEGVAGAGELGAVVRAEVDPGEEACTERDALDPGVLGARRLGSASVVDAGLSHSCAVSAARYSPSPRRRRSTGTSSCRWQNRAGGGGFQTSGWNDGWASGHRAEHSS